MKKMFFGSLAVLVCTSIAVMAHSQATTQPSDKEAATCTACEAKAATRPATQPASDAKPVNKFCPIEPDEEINPRVTIVYEGRTIGFCCKDCISDFEKDPAKYLAGMK